MKALKKVTKNLVLAQNVLEAKTFLQRGRGLMFKKSWPSGHALWIHRCRDIHTCFMKFPIDVLFVDKKLVVTGVYTSIRPWRFIFDFKANSVFEFIGGSINHQTVEVGDQLNVDC